MTNYISIHPSADAEKVQHYLKTSFAGTPLAGRPETEEEYASGIIVSGNDFHIEDISDLPEADEVSTNNMDYTYRYDLDGVTVFLEYTEGDLGLHFFGPDATNIDCLREWDYGDLEECEFLASFGFDEEVSEAPEDAESVRIWKAPNYYAGTLGAPVAGFVEDENGEQLVFADKDSAQAWIDEQEDGMYMLSHGEAGRPSYTIVE